MNLEAKKYSLIQWIISVADEQTINEIEKIKSQIKSGPGTQSRFDLKETFTPSSLTEIESRAIDVSQLKEEQNYQPLSTSELNDIIESADIEQSIDELLVDLQEIG